MNYALGRANKISYILITLLIFYFSNTSNAQCPTLVWSDEFDGNTLDTLLWKPSNGQGASANELSRYIPEAHAVKDGKLVITARKINANVYVTGRLSSKANFKYGKFEARIKLPEGKGMWPAFWLLPANDVYGPWPQSGEIDIVETRGSETDVVNGYINYGTSRSDVRSTGGSYAKPSGKFSDDFHVYRVEWAPDLIKWYVDDIFYCSKKPSDISPYFWAMNEDFRIMFTHAIGGDYAGAPDETTVFPNTMEVDYVRVYSGSFLSTLTGDKRIPEHATNKIYKVTDFPSGSTFNWTVPEGATIVSGQGTDQISVNWGTTGGLVNVEVVYPCGVDSYSLSVSTFIPDFIFEDYESNRNISYLNSMGTLTDEITNPLPGGTNTSSVCAMYQRNAGFPFDAINYSADVISDANKFRNGNKKFHLDIYTAAPIGSTVVIQLMNSELIKEPYPKGFHSVYKARTTKQNEWETLEFDYEFSPDNVPSNAVDLIQVLFNSGTNTNDVFYMDNFLNVAAISTPENQNPEVKIVTPFYGAKYSTSTENLDINLSAKASDIDGSIVRVEYYHEDALIGSSTTPPYQVIWEGVVPGNYTITAKAIDDKNGIGSSGGVKFSVSKLLVDMIEDFEVNRRVVFQSSNGILESNAVNPESLTINTSAVVGKYTRSTDQYDQIKYATSFITNANEYKLKRKKFRMDIYTDMPVGSKVFVQLENAAKAAEGYPKGIHSFYTAFTTTQNQWETLEFEFEFSPDENLSASSINQILVLFNSGSSSSATVYFDNFLSVLYPNLPPKIKILNPKNYSILRAKSNIVVEVDAKDVDGEIAKVEYFNKGTFISTKTTAPYSLALSNVVNGDYLLTAVVTDNSGAKTESNLVQFVINKLDNMLDNFENKRLISYWGANALPRNTQLKENYQNLSTTGLNISKVSGEYTRNENELNDYFEYDFDQKININDFISSKKIFTMDVFSKTQNNVPVYLALGNTGGLKYYFVTQINTVNEWTTLNFIYAGANPTTSNTITKLYILINPGTNTSGVYLIDNISTASVQNVTPVISLVAPDNDETYDLGESVHMQAMGIDYDGVISEMDFYAGKKFIGTASSRPFEFTWPSPQEGVYMLTARAKDDKSGVSVSNTVRVIVGNPLITAVDNPEDLFSNSIRVFPNPFNDQIIINCFSNNNYEIDLALVNSLGQAVYNRKDSLKAGDNTIVIDSPEIPTGLYYLIIRSEGYNQTVRVLKN